MSVSSLRSAVVVRPLDESVLKVTFGLNSAVERGSEWASTSRLSSLNQGHNIMDNSLASKGRSGHLERGGLTKHTVY